MRVGAHYCDDRCEFIVWAPEKNKVKLALPAKEQECLMKKDSHGYWRLVVEGVKPGTRYGYLLNDTLKRPDPASHFQPEGVHAPSEVVDHNSYRWNDGDWKGLDVADMIFYEMHVGTFTTEGTFVSAASRVKELSDLGVNAVELMPVAQFAGDRNWGYDGVYPYAVQNSYGTPDQMKGFVDECHAHGIAVVLDVVFNHLGLEGNYLNDYGPYFTKKHETYWGPGINFDGVLSRQVRDFFLECTLHWMKSYHIDGFRLDAVHAIHDDSSKHFLKELAEVVETASSKALRKINLIAESDLNDPKIIRPISCGGFGLDAQWLDDFHHSLHSLLTSERNGYYADFGQIQDMLKALAQGYVYSGQYSKFRKKKHGLSSSGIPPRKFVVFSQNHDQIGNRRLGERLLKLAGFEAAKLAAGLTILSPYIPLLFMGEEYGEDAPFLYFTSYGDSELASGVSRSRMAEFSEFDWQSEPPDPQGLQTFQKSKIKWDWRYRNKGKKMLEYYRHLIRLRTTVPPFANVNRSEMRFFISEDRSILFMKRGKQESRAALVANFSERERGYRFPFKQGIYRKALDSSDLQWQGPGSRIPNETSFDELHTLKGFEFAVFLREMKGEES